MAEKRITISAGSTNNFRGDVLRVLGALKVATADQIQRIGAPHLNHRHTGKKTPSKRKQARTASHTGALRLAQARPLARTAAPPARGSRCGTRPSRAWKPPPTSWDAR